MRYGDRERDDTEPVGGVGTTPDEPDRDAAEDADARARDASGLTTDVSRDGEAREALRAYRALPTLHSYLGEVGDVRGGAAAHADLELSLIHI